MKNAILKYLFFSYITVFSTGSVLAQFSVDAHYRNRLEVRNGYQKLMPDTANPAVFISQRTRLSFNYEIKNLKLKFTPQDVRIWGDEQLAGSTAVFGDNASLELFEAFAEIKLSGNSWLSVGRQQLKYDNYRLLGDRNWNQTGIAYDAVVYKLNKNDWKFHLGSSWNSTTDALSENHYPSNRIKSLNFVWLNHQFQQNLNVSFLHIATGITSSDTTNTIYFRQTTGFYADYKNDKLSIWGDAYYQYGKNKLGNRVSAFLIDADASYKIGKLTPGIGLAFLSGNRKTGANMSNDNLFDVFYGNRHKFFGFIDYFRDFPTNTKEAGLADYYIYIDYQFTKSISLRNIGHYFLLAQSNEKTPSNKNLGFENDLVLKYKFSEWGSVESGYFFFLPTNTLKTVQKVNDNHFSQFFYLQITITPILFKQ